MVLSIRLWMLPVRLSMLSVRLWMLSVWMGVWMDESLHAGLILLCRDHEQAGDRFALAALLLLRCRAVPRGS